MNKPVVTPKAPKTLANEFVGVKRKIKTPIVYDSPEFEPKYQTEGSACCDLKANLPNKESILIGPMETVKIDAGFSIAVPPGFEAQIRPRSGFGAKSIIMPNSPGTIDDDYRGRMCVLLTNLQPDAVTINHLDRIAQMKLSLVWYFDFEPVTTLNNTERGAGGFGSTGV